MHATTLVLGGSGFLGAHVARAARALEPEARVVAASREPARGLASHGGSRIEAAAVDALRDGDVEELFGDLAPRRVILCTALSKIADCEAYPRLAAVLNVELPRRIAELSRSSGARLVHVSTDLVFGAHAPPLGGLRESDAPAPMSVYGRTKAQGEEAVLEALPAALVVRLPLLFGPSHGRGLGASDSLLAALARGEQPVLFEDEWRTPLSVVHAARAIAELASRDDLPGVLHVAGAERVQRFDLGLAVLAAYGKRDLASALVRGTRAGAGMADTRPADVSLDGSRARELLSFEIPSLAEALRARA